MTKNQIEFLKLRETQRSNSMTADLRQQELGNKFAIETLQLGESARHNKAMEANAANEVAEKVRHNILGDLHSEMSVNEQRRANLAREAEQHRANVASEQLSLSSLAANRQYQQAQIGLGYSQVAETSRANQAREAETTRANIAEEALKRYSNVETKRSNQARESEAQRHNIVSESITRRQNTLKQESQSEQARHNKASEVSMFINSGSNVVSSGLKIASAVSLR